MEILQLERGEIAADGRTSTIFCEEMTTDGVSSPGNVSKRELPKQTQLQ